MALFTNDGSLEIEIDEILFFDPSIISLAPRQKSLLKSVYFKTSRAAAEVTNLRIQLYHHTISI